MSEGYTPGGNGYRQIGDLGGAVGAGGIYTTVGDLQKWVENYADPQVGTADMIEQMMTPFVLTNGNATGYGFGLFIDEQGGQRRVHHGGADVAHRSMLVYYPGINAGLTVQSNHAGFDSNVAFELGAAFFADAIESEEETAEETEPGDFDPASYDSADFDEFVGQYSLDASPDFILTFSRDGDVFYAQGTGQPRIPITPTSTTTFRFTGVDASVEFLRTDAGEVEGLTLHQNGEYHATRLADEDVQEPWAPTAEELQEFTGRYFSEEIETFITITLPEETLIIFQRRLDEAPLTPGTESDTFTGGGFTFTFERDRNHQVIGFYLANGRTRDVRFEKMR
jgi:hypothetical protein